MVDQPMSKENRVRGLLIVPAYNEAASIAGVVHDLKKHVPAFDVVVIDDGSTNATAANVPQGAKSRASSPHAISLNWGPTFADRFSISDVEALWNRFGPLEAKLKADKPQLVPGFQDSTIPYYIEDLADPYSVDAFIATWNA